MTIKQKKVYPLVLPTYIIYSFINVIFSKIENFPSFFRNMLPFIKILLYILVLFSILKIIKKIDYKIVFFIVGLLLSILLSCVIFSLNYTPIRFREYINFILFVIMPLSMTIYYTNLEQLMIRLTKIGIIFGFIYGIIGFLAIKRIIVLPSYDMSIGYCAIIPMSCILYKLINNEINHRILGFLALIIYVLFTLLFASRGPLINLFIIGTYFEIFYKGNSRLHSKIIVTISFILLVFFYAPILNYTATKLEKVGIESRTISLIANNDIYHSSGRNNIYLTIMDYLRMNPVKIRGIASDTEVIENNQYTHNMYLEILYQFGIFLGGIFLLIITIMFIRDLRPSQAKKNPMNTIFLLLSMTTLQFSSSIWLYYIFWLWLILHIKNINLRRYTYEYSEKK